MAAPHLAPPDDSVKLPKSVIDAAKHAEAFYGANPPVPKEVQPVEGYKPPAPVAPAAPIAPAAPVAGAPPVEPVAPVSPPASVPLATPVQPQVPQAPAEPAPAPQPAAPVAAPADLSDDNVPPDQWRHRYFSMKGRVEQNQQTIGVLQDQLSQLSDELIRTQQLLSGRQQPRNEPVNPPQPLVTDAEREAYGADFIGVVERAAQQAIAPKVQQLEQKNQRLEQELTKTRQLGINDALDARVPNWRDVNRSQEFLRWLSLRDLYSGRVRREMLNAAYSAADAPRVVAFFEGFLRDAQATGATPAPQVQPQPAPRTPAVPLETLAAPGRARPASGDTPVAPAAQPVFTRQQIKTFYDDVRKGVYAGREQEKATYEQQIIAATREGRVR